MQRLTAAQSDRAAGVLLATACGDALGVPYEFGRPPGPGELAEMRGGGLGDFAPGEWSDDTSMAVAIARVAATGADLTTDAALDAVAEGSWPGTPAGRPTSASRPRAVLGATRRRLDATEGGSTGAVMTAAAAAYARQNPHSAGNGALMRTAPVALAHLDDRERLARAARTVAELTHADPLAGDSCVLWCEAIRVAVLDGRRRRARRPRPAAARAARPVVELARRGAGAGRRRGSRRTASPSPRCRPQSSRSCGRRCRTDRCRACTCRTRSTPQSGSANDTDTVAAIAGGLLGARWGASAVPWHWRRAVHGWPGLDGRDLVSLAARARHAAGAPTTSAGPR